MGEWRRQRSDAALVAAARSGDKAAFGLLVERHRRQLLALCSRVVGSREHAQDVGQEAVLAAFLNLHRLRDPARFRPWLCAIGLNIARRWLREAGSGGYILELYEGPGPDPVDRQPTPEEQVEVLDRARRLRHAIALLPPGQRQAVCRFYLLGLTQQEVATELGTTVGAVKTRLHKARASLRDSLREGCDSDEHAI